MEEDHTDGSVTLVFEGGGETDGRIKVLFPTQKPVIKFFRQVMGLRFAFSRRCGRRVLGLMRPSFDAVG